MIKLARHLHRGAAAFGAGEPIGTLIDESLDDAQQTFIAVITKKLARQMQCSPTVR